MGRSLGVVHGISQGGVVRIEAYGKLSGRLMRVLASGAVMGSLLLGGLPPARAETPVGVDLTYAVYAGGFRGMTAKVDSVLLGDSYQTRVELELNDLLSLFTNFELKARGSGMATSEEAAPQSFSSYIRDKKKRLRLVEIAYDSPEAPRVEVIPSAERDDRQEIEPALRDDALDPVAAGFALLRRFEKSGRCEGGLPLYDGRRLYALSVKDRGTRTLSSDGAGTFSGKAHLCHIDIIPLAGFQEREIRKKKIPDSLKVWVAKPAGLDRLVPVRLDIGKLRLHIIAAETRAVQHAELP